MQYACSFAVTATVFPAEEKYTQLVEMKNFFQNLQIPHFAIFLLFLYYNFAICFHLHIYKYDKKHFNYYTKLFIF